MDLLYQNQIKQNSRPVITTDIGEIPNYLTADEVYYISKNNIEEELPVKILEVLNNYEKAKTIGYLGYLKAKESFSLEINSLNVKELINSIVIINK